MLRLSNVGLYGRPRKVRWDGKRRAEAQQGLVGGHWALCELSRALFSRSAAQASSVAAAMRCLMLPTLSSAGRTSSEKTGEPSGSGGQL